jgi:amidase
VHGLTHCAYAPDRDSGGSSGGTGAAVAANLAAVGVGEDTGGSIRLPASANNLVGLRVTPGMISRSGLSPLLVPLDTAGPMARTVRDMATLLDALVGYDPKDAYTAINKAARHSGSYTQHLRGVESLKGARFGALHATADLGRVRWRVLALSLPAPWPPAGRQARSRRLSGTRATPTARR